MSEILVYMRGGQFMTIEVSKSGAQNTMREFQRGIDGSGLSYTGRVDGPDSDIVAVIKYSDVSAVVLVGGP